MKCKRGTEMEETGKFSKHMLQDRKGMVIPEDE